jgi:hypothetical protein
MQIRNADAVGISAARNQHKLLDCRMAMLGLDFDEIACSHGETLGTIKVRCSRCEFQGACAVDLKRDPNNPVWESYCPNSGVLVELSQEWWQTH